MTREDDAFNDLRDGGDWENIIKKYGKSTVYKALNRYLIWIKSHNGKLQSEKKKLESISKALLEENKKLGTINAKKKEEEGNLDFSIKKLHEEEGKSKANIAEKKDELETIENTIGELKQIGITKDLIVKISEMNVESGEELFDRVMTSQQHFEIMKSHKVLKDKVQDLNREKEGLIEKLVNVREDISSETNRRDQAIRETQLVEESINILVDFQKKGYTPNLLRNLLNEVSKLAIKGEPSLSIKRFLDRLSTAKEVEEFETLIISNKSQLKTLKKELAEVKGVYHANKQDILDPLLSVKREAIRTIKTASEASIKKINSQSATLLQRIDDVEAYALAAIENTRKVGESVLNQQSKHLETTLSNSLWSVYTTLGFLKNDLEDWRKIQEKANALKFQIQQATLLLGVLEDKDAILSLDPGIVATMMARIDLYINKKHPQLKTKAPQDISSLDWGISSVYDANLISVSSWLSYELVKLYREGRL